MTFPAPYSRGKDFTVDAAAATDEINTELDNLGAALNAVLEQLQLIQRSDSALANGSVHPNALSAAVLALMASSTFAVRGEWATTTAYAVGDIVEQDPGTGAQAFLCAVAHTSGTFSTDDAAGYWIAFSSTTISAFAATLLDDADASAAQTTLGGTTVGKALFTSASAAAARAALGLVIGTDVLGPTSSGAQLTNVTPRGYLYGLTLANGTDAQHDIDIATGVCRANSDGATLALASAMTKQIDATWAAGTAAGGLFSGAALTADTTYHVFVIQKDADGSIDVGFDDNVSATNIPAGYTEFRRIGSVLTDASANILGFSQRGDHFLLDIAVADVSGATGSTARVPHTLTVPFGLYVDAEVTIYVAAPAAGALAVVTSVDQTDVAPTGLMTFNLGSNANEHQRFRQRTDTSSNIYVRTSISTASVSIFTSGWYDSRGRDGA